MLHRIAGPVLILIAAICVGLLSVSVASAQAPPVANAARAGSAPNGATTHPAAKQEDWTVLPVAQSGIDVKATGGVQLSKVETPEFTREIVRVNWRRGDPIDLYVVIPHGVTRPPVILYLYDYRYDTDRFRDAGWCKRATQGGFAAVGFVSAVSGLQEALGSSTHDVQMILNYLESRHDVDVQKVGMIAQGSGGAIAILSAAVDPRIQFLDLLNPWGDWPDWLKYSRQIPDEERADYLKPEFLQGVSKLDPATYLPHLHVKALRMQEVMDDQVTPAAARDKMESSAPSPKDVVVYKDTAAHIAAWRANGLTGWMSQQLSPHPEVADKLH
jgi:hypothetical protein